MIVRLELDTDKPEDRAILDRVFGLGGGAPVEPEHVATDALVEGRDALRRIVAKWRGGLRLDQMEPAPTARHVQGYVAACGGVMPALLAVWSEDGQGISPAEEAERMESARPLAEQLVLWYGID